jgi:hypothetical protein
LQLLQRVADGHVHRPLMVAGVVDRLTLAHLITPVRSCELGSEDDEVAVSSLLHPLADPFLGLLVLVVVGGVDEVAAGVVICVQQLCYCLSVRVGKVA